jgi:hypothetical protein
MSRASAASIVSAAAGLDQPPIIATAALIIARRASHTRILIARRSRWAGTLLKVWLLLVAKTFNNMVE